MFTPNLHDYDLVLINSSAGKDSQASLTHVIELADTTGYPRDRIVVVHCDLGRVEWAGTRALAQTQAEFYGLRFETVARDRDLLHQIEFERGKFPSSAARYCTSDQKTAQVLKLMTALVKEADLGRQMRILNVLGIRADESPARAKKQAFEFEKKASNGKRHVDRWLAIFDWTTDDVWATIRRSGVPHHEAYDFGMPRLSCVFCIMAGNKELALAARLNPELAAEYVAVEKRIGHTFKHKMSMAQIVEEARAADVDDLDGDFDRVECMA